MRMAGGGWGLRAGAVAAAKATVRRRAGDKPRSAGRRERRCGRREKLLAKWQAKWIIMVNKGNEDN